jgi:hypothetical protein
VPFVLVYGTVVIDHGNDARSGEYGAGKSSAAGRGAAGAAQASAEKSLETVFAITTASRIPFPVARKAVDPTLAPVKGRTVSVSVPLQT